MERQYRVSRKAIKNCTRIAPGLHQKAENSTTTELLRNYYDKSDPSKLYISYWPGSKEIILLIADYPLFLKAFS